MYFTSKHLKDCLEFRPRDRSAVLGHSGARLRALSLNRPKYMSPWCLLLCSPFMTCFHYRRRVGP